MRTMLKLSPLRCCYAFRCPTALLGGKRSNNSNTIVHEHITATYLGLAYQGGIQTQADISRICARISRIFSLVCCTANSFLIMNYCELLYLIVIVVMNITRSNRFCFLSFVDILAIELDQKTTLSLINNKLLNYC